VWLHYVLRRLTTLILTTLIAFTLAFWALRALPGDGIAAQLAVSGASPAQIAGRQAALGLDQPLVAQYAGALAGLLRGDFGISLVEGRTVAEIIGAQLGATLALAFWALTVAIVVGVVTGLLIGLQGRGWPRRAAGVVIAFAQASPVYWTGALAVVIFSLWLRILPSSGASTPLHLVLPASVLGLALSGSIAQVTAGAIHETQGRDFIQTARAKGLPGRLIVTRHVLRPALPALLSVIALQVGFLIGGAAVTEAFFVRPGLGRVLVNAINGRDYPVVQGVVILAAVVYGLADLTADILAAWVDPRLRQVSAEREMR
jgi:peptide/nickel transport system permease protein